MIRLLQDNVHLSTKDIIILSLTAAIAIHTLIFIHTYGVNVPYWDDWSFVPLVHTFYTGGAFWNDPAFSQHGEHRITIPLLILLANVYFVKWNSIYLMYLGWIMISISVAIIYLMLKSYDPKLKWLIILIAAFLYSTSQSEDLLWGVTSVVWFLTLIGFVSSVYFLNKIGSSQFFILPAIVCSVITSFSQLQGLLIWPIGMWGLFYTTKSKKLYFMWIMSSVFIFFIYFFNYIFSPEKGNVLSGLFTTESIKFITQFLSNGLMYHAEYFKNATVPAQIVVGIGILAVLIVYIIYFITKKKTTAVLPWLQFALFGLLVALMTDVGRVEFATPLATRYITLSNFSLISVLVLSAIIFKQHYVMPNKNHRKRLLVAIFLVLLVMLGLDMSLVYYAGWQGGLRWYNNLEKGKECITDPSYKFECNILYPISELQSLEVYGKLLKDSHLGPFAYENGFVEKNLDPLLNNSNWLGMKSINGKGYIGYINSDLKNNTKIEVNGTQPLINIGGWAFFENYSLNAEYAYVFVDDKVVSKASYGLYQEEIPMLYGKNVTYYSGWTGTIDLRNLSSGCHHISARIVKDNLYYDIPTNSELCYLPSNTR